MPRHLLFSAYGCLKICVTVALTVVWCSRSTWMFQTQWPAKYVLLDSCSPSHSACTQPSNFQFLTASSVHPCLLPCTYLLITIILPLLVNVTQIATPVTLHSSPSLPTSNWLLCLTFSAFWTSHACVLSCFSHVWLSATPWTMACQTPLSMGFSRQEYWSGLPFPYEHLSISLICILSKSITDFSLFYFWC